MEKKNKKKSKYKKILPLVGTTITIPVIAATSFVMKNTNDALNNNKLIDSRDDSRDKLRSRRSNGNFVIGDFSTPAKEQEFMSITTTVANNQFKDENNLQSITLPEALTIGENAFSSSSNLSSINLPKVTDIGDNAFKSSPFLHLISLPEVKSIGARSFLISQLTRITIPKVEHIGDQAFNGVINSPSTIVIMSGNFNTDVEKDRIFGAGH